MKVWSISTSIRDPLRVPDFLRALAEVEGRVWDHKSQDDFYIYQIALRVRKKISRAKLSVESIRLLDGSEDDLSYKQARTIFDENQYVGDGMRGRNDIALLVDLGLADKTENVRITPLGKALLNHEIEMKEIMLNFALKLQVPQAEHSKYKPELGYAIRPFTGTLSLIRKVNSIWAKAGHEPKGLSWDEFCIFVPTLINYSQIDNQAQFIVDLRNKVKAEKTPKAKDEIFNSSIQSFLEPLLERSEKVTDKKLLNNLFDYGDNAFRYFQQSMFLSLRGGGRYVDISPLAEAQVQMLLDEEEFKPLNFESFSVYAEYLQDLTSFVPPWSTPDKRDEVEKSLRRILDEKGVKSGRINKIQTQAALPSIFREDVEISQLRKAIVDLTVQDLATDATSAEFLEECVSEFGLLSKRQDIPMAEETRIKQPTQLEYVTFKTFLSINDLVQIKPNYPVDDEGNPTFTAGGNMPDLEIFYKDFNAICEVTMMTNKSQWMMESQPVQRHLADFSSKYSDKQAIGIFIAPSVHRDTKNNFHFAFHYGGDSFASLKVIPFDFTSWSGTVKNIAKARQNGRNISQENFYEYLTSMLPSTTSKETTDEWWERISRPTNILEFIK
jgi:hypothetical protein